MNTLYLTLWAFLTVSAILGWGNYFTKVFRIRFLDKEFEFLVFAILGLATLSFVGAIGQLFSVPGKFIYPGFTTIGVILVLRSYALRMFLVNVLKSPLNILAFLGVALLANRNLVERLFNWCDDHPAYLFFVKSIWLNGDIPYEYSLRRLTSSGLFSSLQTLGIVSGRELNSNAFDYLIVPLLILTLFCFQSDAKLRFIPLAIFLVLLINIGYLGSINSSPILTIVLCCLILYQLLSKAIAVAPNEAKVVFGLIGLVLGFAFAVRPFLGAFGFILVFTFVILGGFSSIGMTGLVRIASGSIFLYLPWGLLQFKDAGTFAYPFFRGNMKESFLFEGKPELISLNESLSSSFRDLVVSGWIHFFTISTVLLYLTCYRGKNRRSIVNQFASPKLVLLITSILFSLLIYYFIFSYAVRRQGHPIEYSRYWVPIFIASLVFVLSFFLERLKLPQVLLIDWKSFGSIATICLISLGVLVSHSTSDVSFLSKIRLFNSQVVDTEKANKERYQDANIILKDSSVLSVVDLPSQILTYAELVSTLDLPGMVSPSTEFPFGKDYFTKVRWLKEQNFDFFAFTDPVQSMCLYRISGWKTNLGLENTNGDWAPFMLEWSEFILQLKSNNTRELIQSGNDFLIRTKLVR